MNNSAQQLNSLLDEVNFYLNKIEGIISEQIRVVKSGNSAQLQILLDRKDELIVRIKELQSELDTSYIGASGLVRTGENDMSKKIHEIESRLRTIIKNEHKCLCRAMQNKDNAYFELKKITDGKRVIKKYSPAGALQKTEKRWEG